MESTQKLWKITNKTEQHNGMKYKTGLNTDCLPFSPSGNCEPGGIYVAGRDILAFLSYAGNDLSGWIREVTIPEGQEVYENPGLPQKFKVHAVILGKRRKITGKVITELVREGANVHADNDAALRVASSNGYFSVVEALLKAGADVHAWDDEALRVAKYYNRAEVVKVLERAMGVGK